MTALGDDQAPLEAELRRRFPAAQDAAADDAGGMGRTDRPFRDRPATARSAARHSRHGVPGAGLAGTAEGAAGKTATYTEIAALGQPRGARAVAAACAANKLALLVPCHRIVRQGRRTCRLSLGHRAQARCSPAAAATTDAAANTPHASDGQEWP